MIVALILLVVYLIVLGVVVWGLRYVVGAIPLDPTVANVIMVAITVISVLIAVILVLNTILPMLGVHSPLPAP